MRLAFLSVNKEKVAGIYGYSYNNTFYFYLPGLNPRVFPDVSPGILLLFECICHAIRDGCKGFDLLRGPANCKLVWSDTLRRSMTLRLYNKSLRTVAFKMMESGKDLVKVSVR